MLIERSEDYRCLVYCGDDQCVCSARNNDKERILMNMEHELGKFIRIPEKSVRKVPIRKKKRTR